MNHRIIDLPARSVPVCHEADICVIGGSCTGVFAAVRAAEAGMSVALVENEGFFGGTAVGGYVPIWHSLYDTTGERKIISGLTDKIQSQLVARGEAVLKGRDNPGAGACLNVQALSLALDELVTSHPAIRPFLHARVVAAEKGGDGRILRAVIEDKDGRRAIAAKVRANFESAGAKVRHMYEYPGWNPDVNSHILARTVAAYRRLFNQEPEVKAIHAGLECGLFLEKFPGLDMISFGPTLRGVHAPGERLELASMDKFVLLLDDVVRNFE